MRAAVIHETGDPEVLRYEEAEPPEPGADEVLIRVRAASVNPADWKARRGFREQPLPAAASDPWDWFHLNAIKVDTNGNFLPDCDLTLTQANLECGAMANVNFGTTKINTTYDPNFLYARISNGLPAGQSGLPMPSFQTMLQPEEIWKIVAYIMSLSDVKDE